MEFIQARSYGIAVPVKTAVEEVTTNFSPRKHGFKFVNNFLIDKSELGLGEGKLHFGLCGGMCLYALRKFDKGETMPSQRTPPTQGTPRFRELFLYQSETLLPRNWARFLRWQIRPDRPPIGSFYCVGASTRRQWQRKLRRQLKQGKPMILGLIRSKGLKGDPSRNHQVLAIGYKFDPANKDLTVSLYDPNHPGKTVELGMNFKDPAKGIRPKQSTGEKLRGFFVINEK